MPNCKGFSLAATTPVDLVLMCGHKLMHNVSISNPAPGDWRVRESLRVGDDEVFSYEIWFASKAEAFHQFNIYKLGEGKDHGDVEQGTTEG